jgi:hypothetical protein
MVIKTQISESPLHPSDDFQKNRLQIIQSEPKDYSVEEFAKLIGAERYGYNSCLHKGYFDTSKNIFTQNNETAYAYNYFSLDFDGKNAENNFIIPNPQQVLEILKDQVGDPNIVYLTKSNPENFEELDNAQCFRILYILEDQLPIDTDEQVRFQQMKFRTDVYQYFFSLFPNQWITNDFIDVKIKDPNRIFWGGHKLLFSNTTDFLKVDILKSHLDTYNIIKYKDKGFNRNLNKNVKSPVNVLKDLQTVSANNNIEEDAEKRSLKRWEAEKWNDAQKLCPLLRDFLNVSTKIYHNELFVLYLFMKQISGGKKKWIDAVRHNHAIDNKEKIRKIHRWVEASESAGRIFNEPPLKTLNPSVDKNAPYYLSDLGNNNLNHKLKKVADTEVSVTSMDKIRDRLDIEILNFLREDDQKVLLIAPTGSGKTHILLEKLIEAQDFRIGTIIAFPRHALIAEKANILKAANIPFRIIKKKPILENEKLNNDIKSYYDNGNGSEVQKIYNGIIQDDADIINKYQVSNKDKNLIIDYVKSKLDAINSSELILTTHDAAILNYFPNHNRLIFDEDPINAIVKTYELSLNFLKNCAENNRILKAYTDEIFKEIGKLDKNTPSIVKIKPNPKVVNTRNLSAELNIKNIYNILNANKLYIVYEDGEPTKIVASKIREPKKSFKNIMIMSATPEKLRLNKVFGDCLHIVDLGEAKIKGKIFQFADKSFSKATLKYEDNSKIIVDISFYYGNTKIIGVESVHLKNIQSDYSNFYNNSGSNMYIGYDILIVGTPYTDDYIFPVWANTLGIQFETDEIKHQTLIIQNHEVNFRTYTDSTLREMHYSWMQSLLMQAVGRARLADNNRKVVILSKVLSTHPQTQFLYDIKSSELPEYIKNNIHLTGSLDPVSKVDDGLENLFSSLSLSGSIDSANRLKMESEENIGYYYKKAAN